VDIAELKTRIQVIVFNRCAGQILPFGRGTLALATFGRWAGRIGPLVPHVTLASPRAKCAAVEDGCFEDCPMRLLIVTLGMCLASACTLGAAEETHAPSSPDHTQLRTYIDSAGKQHPVERPEDWAIRRRHILAGMQEAMGPLPDRSRLPPLDVRCNDQDDQVTEGVRRQTISFASGDGDRVAAYLYVPPHASGVRLPAMLALHQTSKIGKGEVAGLGANKHQGYGAELAARGYIVIAPDYPSFGDSQKYDFQADRYQSGTMKGIFNHMRAVDLLVAREDVDANRLGVIGHSLGGHNAIFVGVFDERLKAIVSSCGWTPFADYYRGNIAGWTSDRYMPRLRDEYGLDPNRVPFDFYELVAALAPRAFFSNSPLHDDNFDVQGVKKVVAKAGEIYDLLGVHDCLQVRYPDCDHDFPDDVRRDAYRLIDDLFDHKPIKEVP
jgi:pimeloyl-ACP methyl ester carboxylesterase